MTFLSGCLLLAASAVYAPAGRAAPPAPPAFTPTTADGVALLARADGLRTADHPQFEHLLAQLGRPSTKLDAGQRWQLRNLEAWEAMYEGDYPQAERRLRDVVAHAGAPDQVAKANALLMTTLSLTGRYLDAYRLANQLTGELPRLSGARTRFQVLLALSQMLAGAGQTDLALHYARMMEASVPPGESPCRPRYLQAAALDNAKRLNLDSPELQRAIAACTAAREPVIVDALQLMQGELYLTTGQARRTLALLDAIQPGIRARRYYPHAMSAQLERAQALEQLGDDAAAKRAARAVLDARGRGGDNGWVRDAYEVLYRVEKRQGDAAEALADYVQFTALDKRHLDDVNARAAAYETVQQHMLAQQLETERLGRQNASLRMQQALAAKTAEATRLYIALLLAALGCGGFVLLRLRRSQQRFKRLSRLDGLTELLNRQHFMSEAEQVLRQLGKRGGTACLAYLDLDHFKRINDTHGHAAGDAALRQVVAACRQHVRPQDLFGRLGGEEFGILLVDCTREQALAIAERIRQAVAALAVRHGEAHLVVSVSLGLAVAARAVEWPQLCREADAALYRAKRDGRNRVEVAVALG